MTARLAEHLADLRPDADTEACAPAQVHLLLDALAAVFAVDHHAVLARHRLRLSVWDDAHCCTCGTTGPYDDAHLVDAVLDAQRNAAAAALGRAA